MAKPLSPLSRGNSVEPQLASLRHLGVLLGAHAAALYHPRAARPAAARKLRSAEVFKSRGVFQYDDVGIVIRSKFMTKLGTSFSLRKELCIGINNDFDDNGLEFSRRNVPVAIPGLKEQGIRTQAEKTAIVAASQAAPKMAEHSTAPASQATEAPHQAARFRTEYNRLRTGRRNSALLPLSPRLCLL